MAQNKTHKTTQTDVEAYVNGCVLPVLQAHLDEIDSEIAVAINNTMFLYACSRLTPCEALARIMYNVGLADKTGVMFNEIARREED